MDRIFVPSWDEVIRYLCDGVEPTFQSTGFQNGRRSSDVDWYNFDGFGSAAQATKYLGKCITDAYDGSYAYERNGSSNYWLRNISKKDHIMYVYSGADGSLDATLCLLEESMYYFRDVSFGFEFPKPGSIWIDGQVRSIGVRPAMWLDLR